LIIFGNYSGEYWGRPILFLTANGYPANRK
jgi:hypothetical protein